MRLLYPIILFSIFVICSSQKSEQPSKTSQNLIKALQAESDSKNKYEQIANFCKKEGLKDEARMFAAFSKALDYHGKAIIKVLDKLEVGKVQISNPQTIKQKKLIEFLPELISEKTADTAMYVKCFNDAVKEGFPEAKRLIIWLKNNEEKEYEYLVELQNILNNKNTSKWDKKWYVCPVCGKIYYEPDLKNACEMCMEKKERFATF